MQHRGNLAAKESGLKCACVNNDDFTVLVSGCGRHHWVSMCTVWLSHSKWLSEQSNKSASNFVLSLNIPLWKLFIWFRSLQIWATGDWQLRHDNMPIHALYLVQSCVCVCVKHQITQVPEPFYSPDLAPCGFWIFSKLKSPLRGKRFQTSVRFKKVRWGSWRQLGELCEVSRYVVWRGLRYHCPMYNVSCILYLLQ